MGRSQKQGAVAENTAAAGEVYYRLPRTTEVVHLTSRESPLCLSAATDAPPRRGFLVAPFVPSAATPLCYFVADTWETIDLSAVAPPHLTAHYAPDSGKADYVRAFAAVQEVLQAQRCDKVVLARQMAVTHDALTSQQQVALFAEACRAYSESFVCLFSSSVTGTWLVATPEILLSASPDGTAQTMALAGTMPIGDSDKPWSEKNKHEHAVVVDYLCRVLAPCCSRVAHTKPYTVAAGSVVHLRTDFSLTLCSDCAALAVAERLHPTPAVCGQPTVAALRAIVAAEPCPRAYYSGYAGPCDPEQGTHLFVTLRCAHLADTAPTHTTLFAGGGIMPDSNCADEWAETQHKLRTILQLFS